MSQAQKGGELEIFVVRSNYYKGEEKLTFLGPKRVILYGQVTLKGLISSLVRWELQGRNYLELMV